MQEGIRVITWDDFGTFLQRIRRRRGITQVALAEELGCTQNYIWRLEKGNARPSRILLQALQRYVAGTLMDDETALLDAFLNLRE